MMDRSTPKLYTRTGDSGTTGLFEGKRVHKDSLRIQAIGEVDELNCHIGVIRSLCRDEQIDNLLRGLQDLLFELGAELAHPASSRLIEPHAARVEQFIDRLEDSLPPLRTFILPGGDLPAAQCHLARSVCRRAERCLFRLSHTEPVNAASLRFLNRLSDLLFVVARTMNHRSGTADIPWKSSAKDHNT